MLNSYFVVRGQMYRELFQKQGLCPEAAQHIFSLSIKDMEEKSMITDWNTGFQI